MKVPQLRFPEFDGVWKPAKAGDAFTHSKVKGETGLPIYSVTLDQGLVPRDSLVRKMGADAADDQNLRAKPGDLVYNMMRMWQGAVGVAHQDCMVSPAYVVISPKNSVSSDFFNYWFQNKRMLYLLWAFSHGLTSDRLRLYFNDFSRIPVGLPKPEEQSKIAEFLGSVDAKLTALEDEREALTQFKTGLMQQVFTQRLRFARSDGTSFPEWQEMPFSEIAERSRQVADPENLAGDTPVVELENLQSGTGRIIGLSTLDGQTSLKSKFSAGEVLFGKLRPYLRKFARPDFDGVCSSEIWVFRGLNVSNEFLFYLIQSEQFGQVACISTGSKMPRSDWSAIVEARFEIPHREEQSKISTAFAQLDRKIQSMSDKITLFEEFKKGLLQQLFA
jgi:type I restriction enzyme S subunit